MSGRNFAEQHFFQGQEYSEQALRDFLQSHYFLFVGPEEDPDPVYQGLFDNPEEKTVSDTSVALLKTQRDSSSPTTLAELLKGLTKYRVEPNLVDDRHKDRLTVHFIQIQKETLDKAHAQEAEQHLL